ncbi:RagB/SusD family nutrient uptake outer membrane protein [Pedobacter sp. MC2016-14]|uniref:RagB/SusD family nutrient uptake outer membrane protein n=1 Tax=Pedobacter sp. MC2016-14 TaxID=2897327 RepID=UPI001E3DE31F|nr:RagB/SusD family nutrient uptake outer membrane protein [Pedobacter sp. MC2016-14]MCD0488679.1 RagB/SusD family nutrient uptake outer membrane protein [Pedobacter sp. MC2016-14]
MKKIIYILSAVITIGLGSGCKRTFDTPNESALDPSIVFSTPSLAEPAVAGILQSFGETNSYRGRYLVNYGINTDVEVYNSLKSTTGEQARLSNYNTNVDNGQMNTDNNAWAKFYEGIERANLAVSGLRKYGNIAANPEMAQILGEVLTIRAVLYNDLIKGWGDVPARFEPIELATNYLPRSDRDVIYKQLLADLAEAQNYLPWPNGNAKTSSVEHVSKAFAKGLRARLALGACGYAQRLDGTVRLSTDPDLTSAKMYAIAKKECVDIIDSKSLKLLAFKDVFVKLNEEAGAAGLESIWEIPFSENRGRVIFDLGVRHTTTDKYTAQARGGNDGPNPIMYYEYETGDVRRDVSIVSYEWTNGIQVPSALSRQYFGKYRYEWMKRRVTNTNDDGLNWMYMRYADVVLMAAEAVNAIDGHDAAAPYLKMIRDRAFPNDPAKVATFMTAATVSDATFQLAIENERALEFVGEMLRKADLIRWNKLSSKLNEAKTKLIQLENRQGKYATVNTKIYYKTLADGETVQIYGLNPGETGVPDASYTLNKTWTMVSSGEPTSYWESLFIKDPNLQQYWPIWQVFLNNSNGLLNNKNLGL